MSISQSPLHLLSQNRTYLRLWVGANSVYLATMLQLVAAGWIMTTLTSSAEMVALLQACATLPLMMFSIVFGALSDSLDRRKMMIVSQIIMMFIALFFVFITFLGLLSPWVLLGLTFLHGVGLSLQSPAWNASVGSLVSRQNISNAVAINVIGFNLMRSLGPAFGGFIIALGGVVMAFIATAFCHVYYLFVLLRWQPVKKPKQLPPESLGLAILNGLQYVILSRIHLTILIRVSVFCFGTVSVLALLPLIALRSSPIEGALGYGIFLGSFGFGAISAGVFDFKIRGQFTRENLIRICSLIMLIGLVFVALAPYAFVCFIGLFLCGASWMLCMTTFQSLVQLSTPKWMVGRAISILNTTFYTGMTIGSWAWGYLAEMTSLSTSLLCSSLVMVLVLLVGLIIPISNHNFSDTISQQKVPIPDVSVNEKSGPIKISVEYNIKPEDTISFCNEMAKWRHIRKRDGARRWSLNRDLVIPSRWIETFHVSTWAEYLRHNERRTDEDDVVMLALRSLQSGPDKPIGRRMIEQQLSLDE